MALTGKRRKALHAILDGATAAEAATAAGVDRVTVWRWLSDPEFVAALIEASDRAIAQTAHRLTNASERAVSALVAILDDPAAPPAQRIRAADLILSHVTKIGQYAYLAARIAALEGGATLAELAGGRLWNDD